MKIAIEAQRIFRRNKHGMDFVALEVIRELQKTDHTNQYRIYVADGEDHCLRSTDNFEIVVLKSSNYLVFEQIELPREVNRWRPDLLHCTSNTAPLRLKVPLVVTLHDVIFMENYGSSGMSLYQKLGRIYRRLVVPRIVKKAQQVITVSEYERDVICESLKLCPSKVSVVYNGVNHRFVPTPLTDEIRKRYSLPVKYLFFIGNTDPKKNSNRLLEAYAEYQRSVPNPLPLVIADYMTTSLANVISIGYISNVDLPQIYTGAEVFLYPSLRESFGIPLLEAMGCGTPVISSNTSAIPEIASDAALLIDPYSVEAITEAIIRLTSDSQLHSYYSSMGLERNSRFSWSATARDMLKIYQEL